MLVVMQEEAPEAQIETVINRLVEMGFTVHRSTGVKHTVLGGVGPIDDFDPALLEAMEGVKECHRIVSSYKLANRSFKPGGTIIKIGDVEIGGTKVVTMGGPCSVESEKQIEVIGGDGSESRRADYSRRRVQAAQFALQFSRDGRAGFANHPQGGGPSRPQSGERSDGSDADSAAAAIFRHLCKWARATCRTSTCCANWARRASPFC